MANLWTTYMNDSMATCVTKYFLAKVEDQEVRPVLEYALSLSEQHIREIEGIFSKEQFPIPEGFSEKDCNLGAPRLFSDVYFLIYLQNMSRVGLTAYSWALPIMARADIRHFFREALLQTMELADKVTDVMLSKGIFRRPPFISTPTEVAFVKKQSYLTGWFGDRRPLDGLEITQLYHCILSNIFSKALLIGFSQVARSTAVREYMVRGKYIAGKHIEVFSSLLNQEDLPAPPSCEPEVTDSAEPPFSDKLMMFHTRSLSLAGIANYGTGLATTMRHDVSSHFVRLSAELGHYGDDGANIMIDQGWMEQPPQASDRAGLAKVQQSGSTPSN